MCVICVRLYVSKPKKNVSKTKTFTPNGENKLSYMTEDAAIFRLVSFCFCFYCYISAHFSFTFCLHAHSLTECVVVCVCKKGIKEA